MEDIHTQQRVASDVWLMSPLHNLPKLGFKTHLFHPPSGVDTRKSSANSWSLLKGREHHRNSAVITDSDRVV